MRAGEFVQLENRINNRIEPRNILHQKDQLDKPNQPVREEEVQVFRKKKVRKKKKASKRNDRLCQKLNMSKGREGLTRDYCIQQIRSMMTFVIALLWCGRNDRLEWAQEKKEKKKADYTTLFFW